MRKNKKPGKKEKYSEDWAVLHRYQWDLIQRNDSAGKCGANLATMNKSIVASFKGAPCSLELSKLGGGIQKWDKIRDSTWSDG